MELTKKEKTELDKIIDLVFLEYGKVLEALGKYEGEEVPEEFWKTPLEKYIANHTHIKVPKKM